MTSSRGYIPSLDGWRAVAISAVVASHALKGLGFDRVASALGQEGVDVFFALSGFLISLRLLEERSARGTISLRGFYLRRVYRILPASVAYLCIIGVLGISGFLAISGMEWVSCVFFFRNYFVGGHSFTNHFWSLAVEEHFYMFWPIVIALTQKKNSLWLGILMFAAVGMWRWWNWEFHDVIPNFWLRTDLRVDALLAGCIVALLVRCLGEKEIAENYSFKMWLCAVASFLILRGSYGSFGAAAPSIKAILEALIIAGTAINGRWFVSRCLELPPVRWVGRISYSLYLWNMFFLLPYWNSNEATWTQQLFRGVFAVVVASSSYYLIERPLIKIGHIVAKPISIGRGDLKVYS